MKCNIRKPNPRDIERLHEELRKVRCYKCGSVIETHELPIFAIYSQRKHRLCDKCKGVLTDEIH